MNIIRAEEYIYSIPHGGLTKTKTLGTRHTTSYPISPRFFRENIPLMAIQIVRLSLKHHWKSFDCASVEPP